MMLSSVDSSFIYALRIEYMPPIAANDAIIIRQQLYICNMLRIEQMMLSSVDSSFISALRNECMPLIAANYVIISKQQLYICIKN